ncbi:Bifunctional DNA primase/polymerase, N-terminal [Celeribacter indicus]|nr:Bifunctional DNA primase/polymerase, N-terminal [Celeribacter indicus]
MSDFKEDAPGAGQRAGGAEDRHHHTTSGDSIAETPTGTDRNSLLSAAQSYLARGLSPIRLGPKSKKPLGKHDANAITADNAARLIDHGGYNLGLRLGPDHGGLVDFDLDWPEARRLGGLLLDRFARFGREGARGSHYLLRGSDAVASKKFDMPELKGVEGLPDEHAVCVLEVRASGHTMAPPSIHPSGEAVTWERDSALLEDTAKGIYQRAGLLAFLSVVARFYPAQGSRDDFCMALAGALLAAGLSPDEADRCVVRVAEVAGDEEAGKRRKAGQTAAKVEADEAATGIPRVVEMLGLPEAVGKRFRLWLGIAPREDGRTRVVLSENRLHETQDAAEAAMLSAGLPIYQQMGRLVRAVRLDEPEGEDGGAIVRQEGALVVRDVQPHSLRDLMTRVANFVKVVETKEGTEDKPVGPPVSMALAYIQRVREGGGRLPVLRGIVECPTLRPDGTILSEDGYDRATGLILDTGGATFDPVPGEPTRADAMSALDKLKWVLAGFPFVDDASRSVALSAMLTAVCRRSLRTAPMHGFTAPTRGTGKSLLTDSVAMMAMGRPATVLNQTSDGDGEEERKRLMSILMQGDPVVVIDNIDRPMSGARMCSILTQETWQDRLLGGNDQGHVSTRTLWLANGNNLEFREDMSRRAILCTMDAGMENPEERPFDVDLKVEVPRRRGALVPAALTVLRAFVVAGRPGLDRLTPFGSFEDWSDLVRGALVWCGEADPCDTRAEVAAVDSVREELSSLIEAWEDLIGVGVVVTAGELVRRAGEEAATRPGGDGLMLALDAACPRGASPKTVGWYLKKVKGRVIRGRRIVAVGREDNMLAYRLEVVGG